MINGIIKCWFFNCFDHINNYSNKGEISKQGEQNLTKDERNNDLKLILKKYSYLYTIMFR